MRSGARPDPWSFPICCKVLSSSPQGFYQCRVLGAAVTPAPRGGPGRHVVGGWATPCLSRPLFTSQKGGSTEPVPFWSTAGRCTSAHRARIYSDFRRKGWQSRRRNLTCRLPVNVRSCTSLFPQTAPHGQQTRPKTEGRVTGYYTGRKGFPSGAGGPPGNSLAFPMLRDRITN